MLKCYGILICDTCHNKTNYIQCNGDIFCNFIKILFSSNEIVFILKHSQATTSKLNYQIKKSVQVGGRPFLGVALSGSKELLLKC